MLQALKPVRLAQHGVEFEKAEAQTRPASSSSLPNGHNRHDTSSNRVEETTAAVSWKAQVLSFTTADKALGWNGRAGAVIAGVVVSLAAVAYALAAIAWGERAPAFRRMPISLQMALRGRAAKRADAKLGSALDGQGSGRASGGADGECGRGEPEACGGGGAGDAGGNAAEEGTIDDHDDSDSTDEFVCASQACSSPSDDDESPVASTPDVDLANRSSAIAERLQEAANGAGPGKLLGNSCLPLLRTQDG